MNASSHARFQTAVIASIVICATTAAQTAINADSLRRRTPGTSDNLAALYKSPAYDDAYKAAQKTYRSCQVSAWPPSPWHTYKQYEWLTSTQHDLTAWTAAVDTLGKQLERLASNPETQKNPQVMAQIRQLEDDVSADSIRTLNQLVETLPLKDLFNYNHLFENERDWYPREVPTARNTGLLETVSDFARRVNDDLTATRGTKVHFRKTAKFATYADYLLDEKGDPIRKPEPYYIFWQDGSMNQSGTVAPVQKMIVGLHAHLARAQATIAREDLLPTAR